MTSAISLEAPGRLTRAQPPEAAGWLAALPALVGGLLRRWELTAERVAAPGGRTSMTVLVRRADGAPAALKICAPTAPAALEEAALRHWDGHGAVRLLRAAPEDGALLLERVHGETSLRALPDAKAMLEAVSAVRRLWVEPGAGHPFPSVAERTGERAAKLRTGGPAEARALTGEALRLRTELLAGTREELLLHGDFRQGAVLASDAERSPWLAVGPEPLVGERAYDLARLVPDRLHDLVASPGAAALTRRRVTRLAESVDVDPERLRAWSLFRAVASGVQDLAAGRREDGEALLEFASWL
ncbi:aminoglycoside phosphotransferase family protein [Streptomyces sp. NBC_01803]|uniref:aminoglycoside phosphotransferase family protein n=1 Tax=Streptomyces sp. NBC_01803 TaxID=2975946 RepID=UPI002DDA399F|nr:aminoglycoside phosphotransferase family protein [Streptomyces sp. NBC_01803]WSA43938.1 aminoglycoside phosphotransferase family protein [Streptomyces sp. NBC_01803]